MCAAEGRGAAVPCRRRFTVACCLSLAGGEAEGCAGDCDCARAGGLLRFELRAGDCGAGVSARISCGAAESEELRRLGEVYAHALQFRDERGLSRGAEGIDGRRPVRASFLCGIFDGWEFGDQDGGRVRGGGAACPTWSLRDLPGT